MLKKDNVGTVLRRAVDPRFDFGALFSYIDDPGVRSAI